LHGFRILDEFEKAKQGYEASLTTLRDRMNQRGNKASTNENTSAAEAEAEANVHATLETVVDVFLTDPVNFKAEKVPAKKSRTQEAVSAIAVVKDQQGHREATEDTKHRYHEKEQPLVRLHDLNYVPFPE
jgi:uncharacterized protein YaiL (DUF2058 family)